MESLLQILLVAPGPSLSWRRSQWRTGAQQLNTSQQWYNFVHSLTRFFVEETFWRWKNRFRCLLKQLEFK